MLTAPLRTTYMDVETRTVCDIADFPLPDGTPAYSVNRINTLQALRGRGLASRLMRERVLPEVDRVGAILYLEIVPSGGLEYVELAQWYYRLGFRPEKFGKRMLWVRRPIVQ